MANTPDGPKWTAWNVTRWRARDLSVSECEFRHPTKKKFA